MSRQEKFTGIAILGAVGTVVAIVLSLTFGLIDRSRRPSSENSRDPSRA